MIDPVVRSKLDATQFHKITRLRIYRPDVDVDLLARMIVEGIFDPKLITNNLLKAAELLGPFAVDEGKRIWHYSHGVWLPDGEDELTRRVIFCTGKKYRSDQVHQVASIIKSRVAQIVGLGPISLLNVGNGMLDWKTLDLLPWDPKHFSTYQLRANWNPESQCPTIDAWMAATFEPDILKLLWQVVGVAIHPSMGFQKAIVLIGDGLNGKGTFLRLCQALISKSAICAIDPKILNTNRFAAAELFGKTANICGDIERVTFNSTAEFKKITGEDLVKGERKMGHPFYFKSEATLLFSGNKMPPSRDTSYGWIRRWLIIPMNRRIEGPPDRTLNERMALELDGALVHAVRGLRESMNQGSFDEPAVCKAALLEYEYSCNSSTLFVNERLEFSEIHTTPIGKSSLFDSYTSFCRERKLEPETRPKFYAMVETMGGSQIGSHWAKKSSGADDRGYIGIKMKSIFDILL